MVATSGPRGVGGATAWFVSPASRIGRHADARPEDTRSAVIDAGRRRAAGTRGTLAGLSRPGISIMDYRPFPRGVFSNCGVMEYWSLRAGTTHRAEGSSPILVLSKG